MTCWLIVALAIAVMMVLIVHIIRDELPQSRVDKKTKRKPTLDRTLAGREALNPEKFYQKFFRELGVAKDVAIGVREILEQVLEADLSRLIDSDDFSGNLRFFFEFDSLADAKTIWGLEQRFGISISNDEARKLLTVKDIVMLVDRKAKAKS